MYNHTYYALFSISCRLSISIILSQSPTSLALETFCLLLFLSALSLPSASGCSLAHICNKNLNHMSDLWVWMSVGTWISICWFLQLNSLGSVRWCLRYLRYLGVIMCWVWLGNQNGFMSAKTSGVVLWNTHMTPSSGLQKAVTWVLGIEGWGVKGTRGASYKRHAWSCTHSSDGSSSGSQQSPDFWQRC